jgi:choice-of-anchor C domain-containing protein
MKTSSLFLTVIAGLLSASTSVHANLIVNGSFETGNPQFVGSFTTLGNGSTRMTGWTVTGNSVDWINTYWQAAAGNYSVDLSGNAAGGVQQTIATTPGGLYRLSFELAGNPDGPPTIKDLEVLVNGSPLQSFTFDTAGHTRSSMGWQGFSLFFTAAGSSTTLEFRSLDATAFGPALDNVVVDPIPEPSSLVIGAAIFGVFGAGFVLRRRLAQTIPAI